MGQIIIDDEKCKLLLSMLRSNIDGDYNLAVGIIYERDEKDELTNINYHKLYNSLSSQEKRTLDFYLIHKIIDNYY